MEASLSSPLDEQTAAKLLGVIRLLVFQEGGIRFTREDLVKAIKIEMRCKNGAFWAENNLYISYSALVFKDTQAALIISSLIRLGESLIASVGIDESAWTPVPAHPVDGAIVDEAIICTCGKEYRTDAALGEHLQAVKSGKAGSHPPFPAAF